MFHLFGAVVLGVEEVVGVAAADGGLRGLLLLGGSRGVTGGEGWVSCCAFPGVVVGFLGLVGGVGLVVVGWAGVGLGLGLAWWGT